MLTQFFELRGTLSVRQKTFLGIFGVTFYFLLWWSYATYSGVKPSILPSPIRVVTVIPEMIREYNLIGHTIYSICLNLLGYVEGVIISLVFGFVLGLYPGPRAMNEKIVAAIRFLPMTPLLGVMVAFFGIGFNMKVQFLALGMIVYLLPLVIKRIDEVEPVYEATIRTLGATKWQMIKKLYIPDVLSRMWGDIVVLVAITWTYIIIAEMINSSDGGMGSLVFIMQKQARADMYYAITVIILVIGVTQDKIMNLIGKITFPSNYV